jgi:hypothetical protein
LDAQTNLFEHFWACLCQHRKLRCGKADGAFVRKLNPHTPVFDPASDGLWCFGFQFSGGHEIDDKLRLRNRNSPQSAFEAVYLSGRKSVVRCDSNWVQPEFHFEIFTRRMNVRWLVRFAAIKVKAVWTNP